MRSSKVVSCISLGGSARVGSARLALGSSAQPRRSAACALTRFSYSGLSCLKIRYGSSCAGSRLFGSSSSV
jgi:hypothetical protein